MKKNISFLKALIIFLGILVIAISIFVFAFIFYKGFSVLSLEFIFSNPKGIPIGTEGGIFPAIIGTLYLGALSGAFAFIFSIFTSCYIVFYAKNNTISKFIKVSLQLLSGFPSILFGLISYTILIAKLGCKQSLLISSITVGVMIIPFITIRFEKILIENSKTLSACLSLGVSKEYAILKMILPSCFHKIISALLLGIAYGMGAAAPVMYTGAVLWAKVPINPTDPFMSLPYHLYILLANGISEQHAYGTAAVLLILLLIINIVVKLLYRRKKYE
ncbi:MAG: ABC transporter permease subunit [Oscillospiraceae bacterium]